MPSRRLWVVIFVVLIPATSIYAARRILPTKAINYTRYLHKQAFDDMFPGTPLQPGATPQAAGYYVVYQHEHLTYYFGPEKSEIAAELYLEDLDKVVDIVKSKRARLQSATTSIEAFPQPLSRPQTEQNPAPSSAEKNNPPATSPRPSQPNPSPDAPEPWWKKVLKVFGF